MLAASNRMSREIIGLGGGVATAIVALFGREIAKQLDKRAQRKAAQRNLKKRGYAATAEAAARQRPCRRCA